MTKTLQEHKTDAEWIEEFDALHRNRTISVSKAEYHTFLTALLKSRSTCEERERIAKEEEREIWQSGIEEEPHHNGWIRKDSLVRKLTALTPLPDNNKDV